MFTLLIKLSPKIEKFAFFSSSITTIVLPIPFESSKTISFGIFIPIPELKPFFCNS